MPCKGFSHFGQKITMLVLLSSALALVTSTAAFITVDRLSARAQLQNRLATLADVVGQNSNAALIFKDAQAGTEALAALRAEPPIVAGCLYDLSGTLFAEYRKQPEFLPCPPLLVKRGAPGTGFAEVIQSVTRNGEAVGILVLTSDLQDLKRRSRHLLLIAARLLVVALVIALASGLLMQRRILKPVAELSGAMTLVTADHDYTARVPVVGCDEIALLGAGFNAMLEELEIRERAKKNAEAKLLYQALNDELTGLPNRRLFTDRLTQTLAAAARESKIVALLYIDLDGFKLVNDSFGHAVGDCLLREVSTRFRSRVRRSDTLARIGGDEFTVTLSQLGDSRDAVRVAHQLLEVIADPFLIEEHRVSIGASIGISLFPENASDPDLLFQQADSAMYATKRSGKNGVMCYTPELGSTLCERVNLESELRGALGRGEIQVHYQPEFDITAEDTRLTRFEALARWVHPTLGNIPPSKFIPIAEESGLILPLGSFVLESACRAAVNWQKAAGHPVQVAVNVSSIQFARRNFVEKVQETLVRTGLKPELLQLELTESVMLTDSEHSIETMKQLVAIGATLAIDDFGTGYSSLSYLQRLPFQALKIDRSFIKGLEDKPEMRAMVDSLITIAHNLNMRVIAEGVENNAQMDAIKTLGGDEVQGYLLGRPTSDPLKKVLESVRKSSPVQLGGLIAQTP